MRRLFVVKALVCLLMCLPLAMMGQTTVFRFVQNAEFASLSQSTGPFSSFNVQVSRGLTTSTGATASLQFSAFSVSPGFTSITFTNEFGPIPPSAFKGHNTQNLALNIDTSTLGSTFFTQSCTLLLVPPFTLSCGAGPVGVIDLEFRENDAQSTRILALEEEVTNGPITTRTHRKADTSTANVQGSVYGTAVSSASATVGVNHQSTLEMIHN